MSLESGIVINIYRGTDTKVQVKEPEPAGNPEMDKLLLRLANKDESDGDGMMTLAADIVNYLKTKLDAGDVNAAKKFLKTENRAMLTKDMREVIMDLLKGHKALK
jgi:hypothetical protein